MTVNPSTAYKETLDYLFSMLPMYQRVGEAAYKANLDNTLILDEFYSHPHRAYKTIHVAGTNGKGSVSHMMAAVLQSAGYKTGLYTSPHYLDFRERIKVNGNCIDKAYVVDFVSRSKEIIEKIQPSFFELTVMMAFDFFRHTKVEIAVIETGMGGRLDSTNIITPEISVITNIGHDHQKFLGNTLPEIAKEKAGIIKPGIPVVIGETHPKTRHVFRETADINNSEILFADQEMSINDALIDEKMHQHVSIRKKENEFTVSCDLFGSYQLKNLSTVLTSTEILKSKFRIYEDAVRMGLQNVRKLTGMIGRFELLDINPHFYCDAAHNAEGIMEMLCQVGQIPHKNLHIMIGFVKDKDIKNVLRLMSGEATYYFTQADIPRALPAVELAKSGRQEGLKGNVFNTSVAALQEITKKAVPEDLIIVTGSIFLIAEVIKAKKNINSLCE